MLSLCNCAVWWQAHLPRWWGSYRNQHLLWPWSMVLVYCPSGHSNVFNCERLHCILVLQATWDNELNHYRKSDRGSVISILIIFCLWKCQMIILLLIVNFCFQPEVCSYWFVSSWVVVQMLRKGFVMSWKKQFGRNWELTFGQVLAFSALLLWGFVGNSVAMWQTLELSVSFSH